MVNADVHVYVCQFCIQNLYFFHEQLYIPFFFQMWVIPAFGAHPQFENGFGKMCFGFSAWFVLVNLSQPLSVFYRMHSVAALMELLISE